MLNINSQYERLPETSISGNSPTITIPIEGLEFQDDAMNEVIEYHLDKKEEPSLKLELLKQSGWFLISGLGVMFYYQPSKKYAQSICDDPAYKNIPCSFFISSHVAGTLLVAGGILMVATNSFIDQYNASVIPIQLRKYLRDPLSRQQKIVENILTWVGSFIASVPFIIITVLNPIPGLPKFLIFSQVCIVGLTNTLLHLLPFKLAFKNKLYRAPFLPLEFICQKIAHSLHSNEEKQAKKLQDNIDKSLQMIKQRLIDRLSLMKRLITINGFKFTGCNYRNEISTFINEIKEQNVPPLKRLMQFSLSLDEISPGQFTSSTGRINDFLKILAYVIGALWVILACAGFWGGTFNEMTEITGSFLYGGMASFLSIYCLCVLLAFFGGNALQNTSDYLTVWRGDKFKISLAFKLYPKTSVLLLLISVYLSTFSYAAGAQLINDNFNDKLDFLRPYLLEIAKTGLTFLGFNAMVDLFINGLSKFGEHVGNKDRKAALQLTGALTQMENSIQLMHPGSFIQSLAKKNPENSENLENPEKLKILLGIKNEHDQHDLNENFLQLAGYLKRKLLLNYESKAINTAEIPVTFVELLTQLENDHFHTLHKVEKILAYLSHSELKELPLDLEVCKDYKNVCKILDSIKPIMPEPSDTDISHYDEGYGGPSTEITPLLSGQRSRARMFTSSPISFFIASRLPPFDSNRNTESFSYR